MVTAYVGLGSNLGDSEQLIRAALQMLGQLGDTRVTGQSRLYRSKPMGPQDQPDYINAVAELETAMAPLQLLSELQKIETSNGRVRGSERWGPRTLDLDLLIYGQEEMVGSKLTIPHEGIAERSFVLYPLADIAPELQIPGKGSLKELLLNCPREGLELIEDNG
jgi:2-amino-4-hydroxy-6-hydroxymethyldihydropteridine diphosphokinase